VKGLAASHFLTAHSVWCELSYGAPVQVACFGWFVKVQIFPCQKLSRNKSVPCVECVFIRFAVFAR
jgi:hypothetical protein